jgi:[acyl-carrier-protein] S-malonyltransferase
MSQDARPPTPELPSDMRRCGLAFRGYNVTNLGRSTELLRHGEYGDTVARYLRLASRVCREVTGKRADLVDRVRRHRETSLRSYAEAIALIMAMELAQLELLEQYHDRDPRTARIALGYSLGELTAVTYGGMFDLADILRVPLTVAHDCADLAGDVTLGVLFSRGPALDESDVVRLCLDICAAGDGALGISAVLSPNSMLLVGQHDTLSVFGEAMRQRLHPAVHLRLNPNRWPPLHTSLMWQRSVPDRVALLLQNTPVRAAQARPDVMSLLDTDLRYTDLNARDIMHRWVDHPQRLWDGVYEVLSLGIETVIHIGPAPNLIPATFKRLSTNVMQQASGRSLGSLGLRAVAGMIRRPWLAAMLPSRTALLRAPEVRHVILEDWLLARD